MINVNPVETGFINLRDLIVANNGGPAFTYVLNTSNIEFGTPSLYADAENPTANTQVTVSALLDQGYSGSVDVSYYRPTLAEAHTTPVGQIEVDTHLAEDDMQVYADHVLATIANAMQLRLEDIQLELDAADLPVPFSENTPLQINILPREDSLIYSGGPFAVTFAAIDTDIPLDEVITVTALSGFDF